MIRAKKTLNPSDVDIAPIKLKHTASFSQDSFSAVGISVVRGINQSIPESGKVSTYKLNYNMIQQLFYNSYITGSLLGTGSAWISNEQSFASSGSFDEDYRNFPIEENANINVLYIPRNVFGEQISRNSIILRSTSYEIVDDGNGNLIDTLNGNVHVGNVIYSQAFLIITNSDYLCYFTNTSFDFNIEDPYSIVITPTPTRTPTRTPSNTRTPSITPSRSRTPSITPSLTSTPSITATSTVTPSVTPSQFSSPTPTRSVTPTNSITPSATSTPSITPTSTITPTRTASPSITPSISISATRTPSVSVTPTNSVTPSITTSTSITPSLSVSSTVTPTTSVTPSLSVSNTVTPTVTPTNSVTSTVTPSITPSLTASPTVTPTVTVTPSRSPFPTPSITSTPTMTITPSPSMVVIESDLPILRASYSGSDSSVDPLVSFTQTIPAYSTLAIALTNPWDFSFLDASELSSTPQLDWQKAAEVIEDNSSKTAIYYANFFPGGDITINASWNPDQVNAVLWSFGSASIGSAFSASGQLSGSINLVANTSRSILLGATADYAAIDGSTRNFTTSTVDAYYFRDPLLYTSYFYRKRVNATGSQNMGILSPDAMQASSVGLEIRGSRHSYIRPSSSLPSIYSLSGVEGGISRNGSGSYFGSCLVLLEKIFPGDSLYLEHHPSVSFYSEIGLHPSSSVSSSLDPIDDDIKVMDSPFGLAIGNSFGWPHIKPFEYGIEYSGSAQSSEFSGSFDRWRTWFRIRYGKSNNTICYDVSLDDGYTYSTFYKSKNLATGSYYPWIQLNDISHPGYYKMFKVENEGINDPLKMTTYYTITGSLSSSYSTLEYRGGIIRNSTGSYTSSVVNFGEDFKVGETLYLESFGSNQSFKIFGLHPTSSITSSINSPYGLHFGTGSGINHYVRPYEYGVQKTGSSAYEASASIAYNLFARIKYTTSSIVYGVSTNLGKTYSDIYTSTISPTGSYYPWVRLYGTSSGGFYKIYKEL